MPASRHGRLLQSREMKACTFSIRGTRALAATTNGRSSGALPSFMIRAHKPRTRSALLACRSALASNTGNRRRKD